MDPKDLSPVGRKHLHLIEFDKDEKIRYEIRKHPIGLVGMYFIGLLITAGIFMGSLSLAYLLDGDRAGLGADVSALRPLILLVGGLLSILALIMTGISAYLYQSNVVYVTSEKIAQVVYNSIFHRKISQLSIGDIQDISTHQRNVLARLFNYGTLVIETAGEQQNYTFTFTPNPYKASQAIVNAHEENLKLYGN